uniref:Uncharacterized protein n=1 Tax=Ciona savignyi TaxID=51511 RepID=H2YU62_CIOSA
MSSTGKPSDKQNAIVQDVSESNSPFISGSTLMHMLFYTFLMVTVPISSYFVMKDFIFQRLIGG